MKVGKNLIINILLSATITITFAFIGGFNYIGEKFNIAVLMSFGDWIKGENILGLICFILLIYLSLTKTSLKNYVNADNINEDIERFKEKFETKTKTIENKINNTENIVKENEIKILDIKEQSIDVYRRAKAIRNEDIPRLNNICNMITVKIIEVYGCVLKDGELEKESKQIINQLNILNQRIYK